MWCNHTFSHINKATKRAVEVQKFFGGEEGGQSLKMQWLGNIGASS